MLPTASTGKELPGKRDQGYNHVGSMRDAKGHSLSKSEAAREKYA